MFNLSNKETDKEIYEEHLEIIKFNIRQYDSIKDYTDEIAYSNEDTFNQLLNDSVLTDITTTDNTNLTDEIIIQSLKNDLLNSSNIQKRMYQHYHEEDEFTKEEILNFSDIEVLSEFTLIYEFIIIGNRLYRDNNYVYALYENLIY